MASEIVPFVSYVREDILAVEKLVSDLHWLGASPWVDFEKLKGGQDWKREIKHALEQSSHAIVVISKNSVSKRGFFQREVRQALDLMQEFPPGAVFVIPIRLDDTQPLHDEIKGLQWIDLHGEKGSPLRKIASALGLEPPPLQYLSVHTHYYLDQPVEDVATVEHAQELQPFRSNVRHLTIRGIAGSGSVTNVRSSLGSARLVREGGVTSAAIEMASALPANIVTTHVLSYEGVGCFRDPHETVAQNISHVMHTTGVHVHFPAGRQPISWDAVIITEEGSSTIEDATYSQDHHTLSATVSFPPPGSRVLVSWHWRSIFESNY